MSARLFAALVLCLATTPAAAASFDCGKAATPVEKAVCADPALSALDERLAQAYRGQRERLTPQGAERLKADQQGWLRWLRAACPPAGGTPFAQCLAEAYQGRLRDLDETVLVGDGAFRVMLSVRYETTGGLALGPFAAPWIELPDDAATRAWNAEAMAFARPEDTGDEPMAAARIAWAAPQGISVVVTRSWFTPRGGRSAEARAFTWLAGRGPLTAAMLFDPAADWPAALRAACGATMAAQAAAMPTGSERPDAETLAYLTEATCDDQAPERWALSAAGLVIVGVQHAWAAGLDDPVLPWPALGAVLAKSWVPPRGASARP